MKAKEHIYNLRTNLQAVGSQIATATDQHVMFMLDEARATLAAQKMDRKVNVIQMAQFVDAKTREATSEEIGTIGTSKILVLEIPDPIAYLNGGGIFTIGPTDGKTSYSRMTYSQLRTMVGRKYTAETPKWFFLDNKIYLVNVKAVGTSIARVRGIFDEPYKVEIAKGRYKRLAPFDWEYPLSMKDSGTVYKIAMSGDLGWGDTASRTINDNIRKQNRDGELLQALKGMGNAKV